eukprot:COSAG02_NODE_7969_length_2766_cov_2.214098_2_plen_47_part_00
MQKIALRHRSEKNYDCMLSYFVIHCWLSAKTLHYLNKFSTHDAITP